MWKRNPWKDVKHTETALAQEISELQTAGDSVAVGVLKSVTCAYSAFMLSPRDLLLVTVISRMLCLWTRCRCLMISYLCCKNSSCPPTTFKSISRQNMKKAKQLFKSEFSGRHKCSCLIVKITCQLDRGNFAMMERSNAINQNKSKAVLPILCLILIKNIL